MEVGRRAVPWTSCRPSGDGTGCRRFVAPRRVGPEARTGVRSAAQRRLEPGGHHGATSAVRPARAVRGAGRRVRPQRPGGDAVEHHLGGDDRRRVRGRHPRGHRRRRHRRHHHRHGDGRHRLAARARPVPGQHRRGQGLRRVHQRQRRPRLPQARGAGVGLQARPDRVEERAHRGLQGQRRHGRQQRPVQPRRHAHHRLPRRHRRRHRRAEPGGAHRRHHRGVRPDHLRDGRPRRGVPDPGRRAAGDLLPRLLEVPAQPVPRRQVRVPGARRPAHHRAGRRCRSSRPSARPASTWSRRRRSRAATSRPPTPRRCSW